MKDLPGQHPSPGGSVRSSAAKSFRTIAPAAAIITVLAVGAAVLVSSTLSRPEPPSYPPTPAEPREIGAQMVGPVLYTVEATEQDRWHYFDFSRASVVESPGATEWDLAFQRFNIIVNGGEGFQGGGGVVDLGDVSFDEVLEAPGGGYQPTEAARDSVNPVLRHWYDYSFTSHLLTPKPSVYVVRTADGRFAKLQILSYYCPGAQPGCLTFRYLYQGGAENDLQAEPRGGPGSDLEAEPRGGPGSNLEAEPSGGPGNDLPAEP